ncbi:hypothetical protein FRB93_011196 [Tulasnella sp. JGI-2019a]|nr:hypothetical protein FRB93_011196 [Tulasnella sp. JGI-2019a]
MVQSHRQGMLVAVDATSHAIRQHRLTAAVEIAEQGNALLLTHLGGYRMALNDLEVVNKELADRFRTLNAAPEESSLVSGDAKTGLMDQVTR